MTLLQYGGVGARSRVGGGKAKGDGGQEEEDGDSRGGGEVHVALMLIVWLLGSG